LSTTETLKITNCRACGSENLKSYYNFGTMPLANNLECTREEALNAERFPMDLLHCENCGLSQLSIVVPPEKLFNHYVYRSSVNEGYKKHCLAMAETLKARFGFTEKSFMVDIAGNDGTLLKEFKKVLAMPCVNVDPAQNLCRISNDEGIPAKAAFWGLSAAKLLFDKEREIDRFTHADIITATNVFAHVHDVKDFLQAVAYCLADKGVFVVEFPHIVDFLQRREFDTVYFEHLSYFGLTPFIHALQDTGLIAFDAEKFPIHGGTLRLYVCRPGAYPVTSRVLGVRIEEELLRTDAVYEDWNREVSRTIDAVRETLRAYRKGGKTVAGFGASAKGNTLLNACGITKELDYIVDETHEKIGKFSPGTGIKIVSPEFFMTNQPDVIILLAWNFREEMEAKLRRWGYEGEIYCPVGGTHV